MKTWNVLSMKQPWASLLVTGHPAYRNGIKEWETRSWSTDFRGELLIHASKDQSNIGLLDKWPFNLYREYIEPLPYGMIIGKVTVEDVITTERWMDSYFFCNELQQDEIMHERAFGDYGNNRHAWKINSPVKLLYPVAASGSLGLWKFKMPDSISVPLNAGGKVQVDPWIKPENMETLEKVGEKAERIWQRHRKENIQLNLIDFIS